MVNVAHQATYRVGINALLAIVVTNLGKLVKRQVAVELVSRAVQTINVQTKLMGLTAQ